jgi:hypothetical protein
MDENDGHVISFEEAARRHRAFEEAQQKKGKIHEVKLSDPMNHLLKEDAAEASSADEEERRRERLAQGPSPDELRRIVERDFADQGGSSGPEPEERPRPHLVGADEQDRGGQLCSFKERRCWDPDESPDGPPSD